MAAKPTRQKSTLKPLSESIPSGSLRNYEESACVRCGASFRRLVIPLPMIPPREVCEACLQTAWRQAQDEEVAAARAKIRANDGIRQDLRPRTFASFRRDVSPGTAKAAAFMQKWAAEFIEARGRVSSAVLFSPMDMPGVGKTHLAIAAANYIEEHWPIDLDRPLTKLVRFESGPSLVQRIRGTYNVPEHLRAGHETEQDVYTSLIGMKLLILDDVGKEKPSEHTQQVYFHLLDSRQTAPVIITSNLPIDGPGGLSGVGLMNEPTVSRLAGMTGENYFKLTGPDYRRQYVKPAMAVLRPR